MRDECLLTRKHLATKSCNEIYTRVVVQPSNISPTVCAHALPGVTWWLQKVQRTKLRVLFSQNIVRVHFQRVLSLTNTLLLSLLLGTCFACCNMPNVIEIGFLAVNVDAFGNTGVKGRVVFGETTHSTLRGYIWIHSANTAFKAVN